MNATSRVLQLYDIGMGMCNGMLHRYGSIHWYHKSMLNPGTICQKHSFNTQDGLFDASDNASVMSVDDIKTCGDADWDWDNSLTNLRLKEGHSHFNQPAYSQPSKNSQVLEKSQGSKTSSLTGRRVSRRSALNGLNKVLTLSSTDETNVAGGSGSKLSSSPSRRNWEVPGDWGPPINWDPDVAAHCERVTLVSSPPPLVPAREQVRQADPAAETELRQLASSGQLCAALRAAATLAGSGTPPSFSSLVLLADAAAHRADASSLERARRLAARLYPNSYGRAARLRDSQLELLWRRRLFVPACGLLVRYRSKPFHRKMMTRRFAICCCLAAQEGVEDALPHIQRAVVALMEQGVAAPLLSAWQHCVFSETHSFQLAARRLLLNQPAARPHLMPYLLRVLEEAQLTGREDVLRHLVELVLRLGEVRLYPLVFGALLDFQCLVEDVQSAQATFKLVGELSVRLPSTVVNRYSSLLQRNRLKAPAALLRMKYRQRPPDDHATVPKVPPASAWWVKW